MNERARATARSNGASGADPGGAAGTPLLPGRSNGKLGRAAPHTPPELIAATKLIAGTYQGRDGRWAYAAFEWVNATLFEGRLPWPLIVWGITPYSGCLAHTGIHSAVERTLPLIYLHPGIYRVAVDKHGRALRPAVWQISIAWVGARLALDVLIHECIHVAVRYWYGGSTGETSHNCDEWVTEVARITPLLGYPHFVPARSKPTRVGGKIIRVSASTLNGEPAPYGLVARFPHAVRQEAGDADVYYRESAVPWASTPELSALLLPRSNDAGGPP